MTTDKSISALHGLSPKSQAMLARAGITSFEDLQKRASVEVYLRTKALNPSASLNLLWGLESALTGQHWRCVFATHRIRLLLALGERESKT